MVDAYVQLYRSSVLCDVLTCVLEDLVEEEKIQEDLKTKVLDCFDRSCLEALQKRAEAKGQLTVRSWRVAGQGAVAAVAYAHSALRIGYAPGHPAPALIETDGGTRIHGYSTIV